MRRIDREMSRDFALTVVDCCEWATLGMIDPQGQPYCLPVTIARDGESVYFHSAREGMKVDSLRRQSRICMSCVGSTKRAEDEFTTEYESAILRGCAVEVTEDAEKIHALRLICQRHTPANMAAFDEAIARSLSRTAVWKVTIEQIEGKRKKNDSRGREMKFGRMGEPRLKSAFEPWEEADGFRVLVERLWPKDVSKENLRCDLWVEEVAPSTELWQAYRENGDFTAFEADYLAELNRSAAAAELAQTCEAQLMRQNVTLLFTSAKAEHSHAEVLLQWMRTQFSAKLKI